MKIIGWIRRGDLIAAPMLAASLICTTGLVNLRLDSGVFEDYLGRAIFSYLWLLGLTGVIFCHIGAAWGRSVMTPIVFGASIFYHGQDFLAENENRLESERQIYLDSEQGIASLFCVGIVVLLFTLDHRRQLISERQKVMLEIFSNGLIFAWVFSICFLALRITVSSIFQRS